METYYEKYDVYIDSESGNLLESICSCEPEDRCMFKEAWIADGQPTMVMLDEII